MTNLEKSSAKIRELVPRLMNVSIGCRISVSDIGMWVHPCNNSVYDIIETKNYNGECCDFWDKVFLCSNRGWSHTPDSCYLPKDDYPKRFEFVFNSKTKKIKNNPKFDDLKIIGHPITLFDVKDIIRDKHYLIDNWNDKPYLEDQDEKFIEWIGNNLTSNK